MVSEFILGGLPKSLCLVAFHLRACFVHLWYRCIGQYLTGHRRIYEA